MHTIATLLVIIIGLYAGLGAAFGTYFVVRGCRVLDHKAGHAPFTARVLWLPGAAALWPVLLPRCLRTASGSTR